MASRGAPAATVPFKNWFCVGTFVLLSVGQHCLLTQHASCQACAVMLAQPAAHARLASGLDSLPCVYQAVSFPCPVHLAATSTSLPCCQVSNQTTIHVRRPGNPKKWRAKVLCEGKICDLALLTVEEEDFWTADLVSLQFVDVPELQVGTSDFPL